MNNASKEELQPLVLIGIILSVLATIVSLFLLRSLLSFMATPVTSSYNGTDPAGLSFLIPLQFTAFWFFSLLAIIVGFLATLSNRAYAKTAYIIL